MRRNLYAGFGVVTVLLIVALFLMPVSAGEGASKTLNWSGYDWIVSPDGYSSPGPNYWSSNNAWVDSNGDLHLRISKSDNKWYCAEVTTKERLPFGKYQFWVIGRLDQLDKNVVLGMFNYPTSDVGPDGTNEIDIEMSRWSNEKSPMGNYVVWPNVLDGPKYVELFPVTLTGTNTTHRFIWRSNDVYFQSLNGFRDWNDTASEIHSGNTSYTNYVAQKAMPIHINLWLNKGQPPSNGQPVEILIRKFTYTPV